MGVFPADFVVPMDQGGPGQGQRIGGFGGNASASRDAHRDTVRHVGKAPVLLVHGNEGAADTGQWDLLELRDMLLGRGYVEELLWAPSYLGTGKVDHGSNPKPHANNVKEVREFLDGVCEYLDVDVVDVVAHSLGCSLVYAICRGFDRTNGTVTWDGPKKWHRLGTFVALAGAFRGLGATPGEWTRDGAFMRQLLGETAGGGGQTPHGVGKEPTPGPSPHNITYFCAVATGDLVDLLQRGTSRLDGAITKSYADLGPWKTGHEEVKENLGVFLDFLPHLNSVPPAPRVTMTVDKDSGGYASPLRVSVTLDPVDLTAEFTARRVAKRFSAGFIVDEVQDPQQGALRSGQGVTLSGSGMHEVVFTVPGAAEDIKKTYWVDVAPIDVVIGTDNATPFDDSLLVVATTTHSSAALYHSLDGDRWNAGPTVRITRSEVVHFLALEPSGVASAVVVKRFTKRPTFDDLRTANAVEHFVAQRIGVEEYLAYSRQFGHLAPFTLYLVDGDWALDPVRPAAAALEMLAALPRGAGAARIPRQSTGLVVKVRDADPQPGEHRRGVAVTVEDSDGNVIDEAFCDAVVD
jgi:hypothetical protein